MVKRKNNVPENNPNITVSHVTVLPRGVHKPFQHGDDFAEAVLELLYKISRREFHCLRVGFREGPMRCLLRTMTNGRAYMIGYILKWTISPYQNAA